MLNIDPVSYLVTLTRRDETIPVVVQNGSAVTVIKPVPPTVTITAPLKGDKGNTGDKGDKGDKGEPGGVWGGIGGSIANQTDLSAALDARALIGAANTFTGAQSINTAGGSVSNLTLAGTVANRIEWSAVGAGAPAFTTRSIGAKLVLYPALSTNTTDYAIGIESNTMWSTITTPASSNQFKWYAGTTEVGRLSGTGVMTLYNTDTAGSAPALNVNGSFMTIGDFAAAKSFTAPLGIKFYDGGVRHGSIVYTPSTGVFQLGDSSSAANLMLSGSNNLSFTTTNGLLTVPQLTVTGNVSALTLTGDLVAPNVLSHASVNGDVAWAGSIPTAGTYVIKGNSITKTSSETEWNVTAVVRPAHQGSFFISARLFNADSLFSLGILGGSNANIGGAPYAIRTVSGRQAYVYQGNTQGVLLGGVDGNSRVAIGYDGARIQFYLNGIVAHTISPVAANLTFNGMIHVYAGGLREITVNPGVRAGRAGSSLFDEAGNALGDADFKTGLGNPSILPSETFEADGERLFYVDTASTINEAAKLGTGTVNYQRSTTAAPGTFSTITLPAAVQAGAWLKIIASGVSGRVSVALRRS